MTDNPHKKHRKRMRDKYLTHGFSAFAEHEILEMFLFYSIPRKNTNPIAHALIDRFGSIENVLVANINDLMEIPDLGENSAILLKMLYELNLYIGKKNLKTRIRFDDINVWGKYIVKFFNMKKKEELYAFFLDKSDKLISWKLLYSGEVDNIELKSVSVARDAVMAECVSLVLAHNHPGGHRAPSAADVLSTRSIMNTLSVVGIKVKDHIIVADNDYVSMKESNLI